MMCHTTRQDKRERRKRETQKRWAERLQFRKDVEAILGHPIVSPPKQLFCVSMGMPLALFEAGIGPDAQLVFLRMFAFKCERQNTNTCTLTNGKQVVARFRLEDGLRKYWFMTFEELASGKVEWIEWA